MNFDYTMATQETDEKLLTCNRFEQNVNCFFSLNFVRNEEYFFVVLCLHDFNLKERIRRNGVLVVCCREIFF